MGQEEDDTNFVKRIIVLLILLDFQQLLVPYKNGVLKEEAEMETVFKVFW